MRKQFEGPEGKERLAVAFGDQELVRHAPVLAQLLAGTAKLREYAEDEEVYVQGEPGKNSLYFILSGSVDLLIKNNYVRSLSAGQALGEFPVLDPNGDIKATFEEIRKVLEREGLLTGERMTPEPAC